MSNLSTLAICAGSASIVAVTSALLNVPFEKAALYSATAFFVTMHLDAIISHRNGPRADGAFQEAIKESGGGKSDGSVSLKTKVKGVARAINFVGKLQKDISRYYISEDVEIAESTEKIAQAGGHSAAFVKLDGNKVAKIGNETEIQMYEKLKKHWPYEFIPLFYTQYYDETAKCQRIVLEDLTAFYRKPCIIDIKMGTYTYDEHAGWSKKLRQMTKDLSSSTAWTGYRLVGYQVYRPKYGDYYKIGKRGAKHTSMHNALADFLHDGDRSRSELVDPILKKLYDMLHHFQVQTQFRFVGSSILIVYEGYPFNAKEKDTIKHHIKDADLQVKMIDFAHTSAISDGGKDESYIIGLKNLIRVFEQLGHTQKKTHHH